VVAGGSGRRFGTLKQYERVGDVRIIDRSCAVAAASSDGVVVVVPAAHAEREGAIPGGATRSDSVRAGLAQVPDEATIICVHDAARPFATTETYRRVIEAVEAGADGAIPVVGVTDTIKVVDRDGVVVSTPDRSTLVAVQTPQAFRADVLRGAYAGGDGSTDDAGLVELIGGRVVTVAGDERNRKITHRDDLEWARRQALAEFPGSVA
jgi:2-C-methyl-D-erythritol 4-phosphate cytidylyltransferase